MAILLFLPSGTPVRYFCSILIYANFTDFDRNSLNLSFNEENKKLHSSLLLIQKEIEYKYFPQKSLSFLKHTTLYH